MKSLNNNIKLAKETATKLLQNHKLTSPVDLKKLVKLLDITVEKKSFTRNISGLIKRESKKEGKPIIVVNKNDVEKRQRFTIAHEIGHYLLHSNHFLFIDEKDLSSIHFRNKKSSQAIDIKEIQANQFAAELLMPTNDVIVELKKKLKQDVDILKIVKELSEHYEVSTTAMTIKVGNILS
jgi:Zn-dependent peptidase ImmA (M78 family)